jgi:hypothetical protein
MQNLSGKGKRIRGQGPKANAKEAQSPKQLSPKSFNLRHSRGNGNPAHFFFDCKFIFIIKFSSGEMICKICLLMF